MKNYSKIIILGVLSIIQISCFGNTSDNKNFKNLKKKTAIGFTVPYTLRYDSAEWSHENRGDSCHAFNSLNRALTLNLYVNTEEKNLAQETLEQKFHEFLNKSFSNPSFFSGLDIKPSDVIRINGINLLHQSAIICLNIEGRSDDWKKRYISKKGPQNQIERYVYSEDKGSITFHFESVGIISAEDQEVINELFRGFSFDGSACKGPAKLRGLKTVFEALTNQ